MPGSAPALHQRDQLNAFLARAAHAPLADVIMNAFLRTMSRASYSATPSEHFGLGKDLYLHFTSPIRRYSDLLVHQQLWAMDAGQAVRSAEDCAQLGETCTAQEMVFDNAYYAACDRLKLRHLRTLEDRDPGGCHEAVVARVANDGLLMYLPELGLQGFLAASLFRGQHYRRGRDAMSLHAGGSGKSYKCGDFMQVQIRRADPVRGELSLQPVQMRVP
jgi:ribonuclease R